MQHAFQRVLWTSLALVWVLVVVAPASPQTTFDVFPQSGSDYLPGSFVVLANPAIDFDRLVR